MYKKNSIYSINYAYKTGYHSQVSYIIYNKLHVFTHNVTVVSIYIFIQVTIVIIYPYLYK